MMDLEKIESTREVMVAANSADCDGGAAGGGDSAALSSSDGAAIEEEEGDGGGEADGGGVGDAAVVEGGGSASEALRVAWTDTICPPSFSSSAAGDRIYEAIRFDQSLSSKPSPPCLRTMKRNEYKLQLRKYVS